MDTYHALSVNIFDSSVSTLVPQSALWIELSSSSRCSRTLELVFARFSSSVFSYTTGGGGETLDEAWVGVASDMFVDQRVLWSSLWVSVWLPREEAKSVSSLPSDRAHGWPPSIPTLSDSHNSIESNQSTGYIQYIHESKYEARGSDWNIWTSLDYCSREASSDTGSTGLPVCHSSHLKGLTHISWATLTSSFNRWRPDLAHPLVDDPKRG